ncbi:MAG: S26 family signal peptidase [Thermoguttaceae bacterium]
MQCSNCQFQNMPGIQNCGRCGASLQLATSAIDVHPPRASSTAKRWRRWFPVASFWSRFRAAVARSLAARRVLDWASDLPASSLLLRMVVPGWAQWYSGRPIRGRWMLCGFLGLLLSGLLFIGTGLGSLLLGLALALHAASIMDIVATGVVDFGRRLIYSGIAMLVLVIVVYYPVGWLSAQVATPQRFNLAAPPFEAGDVVLVNPSAYRSTDPQPGDIVHYIRPQQDMPVTGRHAIYRLQGDRIDRVLARAGDQVICAEGKLLVNGQPSPWLPLNPLQLPDKLEITVPEHCYLIFPSADAPSPATVQRNVGIVPRAQIWGRVYWRTQPLWRFGAIR